MSREALAGRRVRGRRSAGGFISIAWRDIGARHAYDATMSDPALVALYGALAAILTAVVGAIAIRVQLLPEVIDLSLVPTGSGFGSMVLALYGAIRRFGPDRIGRLSLLGTLLGGLGTAVIVFGALLADVLS